MDKLKGSGNAFSTSGRTWHPFPGFNRKVAASHNRRRSIASRAEMPQTKAEARKAIEQACATHPIKRFDEQANERARESSSTDRDT